MAYHGVKAPEDGDYADDEEDEDVDGNDLVGFEEAVDEAGLRGVSLLYSWIVLGETYQHSNDRNEKDNLDQTVEDEEQASNHFAFVWS